MGALFSFGLAAGFALRSPYLRAQTSLEMPQGPLKLTRRIERSMRGGAMLTVERSWQVRFVKQGQGIAIQGEQVEAKVDAPQSLAPLADLEERRSTEQMWPILLGSNGMILSAGMSLLEEDLAEAVRLARQMVSERAIPADQRASQMQYMGDLQQASSTLLDRLPDDLFYPSIGPMRAVRSIDLPQGLVGQFELSYLAQAVPEKGWLDRAERQIISRIGGSVRTAREEWILRDI